MIKVSGSSVVHCLFPRCVETLQAAMAQKSPAANDFVTLILWLKCEVVGTQTREEMQYQLHS